MARVGLDAADLRSPTDLEWAEDVTGAVARALGGDGSLRFRAHLLGQGAREFPSRAPHTTTRAEASAITDLRGAADGVALRARLSSPHTYAEYLPETDLEILVYEILEQFRVEALAPPAARGVRANVHERFVSWSQEFIAEGLLETDLGLLVFSALQVCRSRILGEPIDERFSDHTEATRFGLYEVLGPHLVDLRPAVSDQRIFAPRAAQLARVIADLVESRGSDGGRSSRASAVLAMISPAKSSDDVPEVERAAGGHLGDRPSTYDVYTREFDSIVDVRSAVPLHAQRAGRAELDEESASHRPLAGYLRRGVRDLFGFPLESGWESEREEGALDPRLLTRVVTGGHGGRIYRSTVTDEVPQAAVSILVDCSGSMKGVMRDVAVLVDLLVRALDDADVVTEVLGYSTGQWSGGRPYRQWLADGRPAYPGRLNETANLIFKSGATSWRRARSSLGALLWTPMFREGVDGEALAWAAARLRAWDTPHRHLLLVCDGSPRDGATELVNGEGYLDRHLEEVAADVQRSGDIRLAGLGIGHDLSAYLDRSRIVGPDRILERPTARTVLDLLGGGPRSNF